MNIFKFESLAEKRNMGYLLFVMTVYTILCENSLYYAWAFLIGIFFISVVLNRGKLSYTPTPIVSVYILLFLLQIINGILLTIVNKSSWAFFRDIIYFTMFFLIWLSLNNIVRKYAWSTEKIYVLLICYSGIVSLIQIVQGVFWFNASDLLTLFRTDEYMIAVTAFIVWFHQKDIRRTEYISPIFIYVCEVVIILEFILSFSRTTYMIFFFLFICEANVFELVKKYLKQIVVFAFGIGIAILILYHTNQEIFVSFVNHLLNSITEISSTNNTWSKTNIVHNWRGYEVYMAQQQFMSSDLFTKLFGMGFGAATNVGEYAYLVTGEAGLAFLHNGYYAMLIKAGVLGVTLNIICYFMMIYKLNRVQCDIRLKKMVKGVTVSMICATLFTGGLFYGGKPFTFVLVIYMAYRVQRGKKSEIINYNSLFQFRKNYRKNY